MNRVKWILLGVCLFGMLIGAAVAYSGYVKKRLDADGAETRAVLTASFSRTECVGYRPGYRGRMHRNFREKRTVYNLPVQGGRDRLYRQGPQNGKSHDGPHRRFGRRALSAGRSRRTSLGPQRGRQIQGDTAPAAQPRPSFGILIPPVSVAVPAVRRPDPS